ncbi:MAG: DUF2807 domain-containing protein [Bacteroidales bacterium]|nr:DUF2807 domain-containing protein [Bacteroidales bacterium]
MYSKILALLYCFMHTTLLFPQQPAERNLQPFTGLYVDDNIIVRLNKSEREMASITVQGIDAEDVITEVKNNVLHLYVSGNLFTRKKVVVDLDYKMIRSIEAINGADVSTNSLLITDSLSVVLKTGGILYLDADVGYLKSHVIEGSLFTGEGYATVQDIYVATSATVSAFDLESDVVVVQAVTNGTAKILAEEELHAQAALKGYITYKGNPGICLTKTASGGTITSYDE